MIKPIHVLLKFDDPSNYSAKYHAYAISETYYSKCHYIRYVWLHLPVFVYTGLINKSLLTSEASSAERSLRALAKVCVACTSIIGNAGQSLCWTCMHGRVRTQQHGLNLFIAFTELIRLIDLSTRKVYTRDCIYSIIIHYRTIYNHVLFFNTIYPPFFLKALYGRCSKLCTTFGRIIMFHDWRFSFPFLFWKWYTGS